MKEEEYYKLVKDALVFYKFQFDDDILQDIVTYIHSKINLFDKDRGNISTFIYALVKNRYLAINSYNRTQKRGNGNTPCSLDKEIDEEGATLLNFQAAKEDVMYNYIKESILKEIKPLVGEPLRLWLEGFTQVEIANRLHMNNQVKVSKTINENIVMIKNYCKEHQLEIQLKEQ